MRIAQVAPLTEAVPPKLYGGTERVVHWLTEELVALGNDVTLFASGDSRTSAKLDATWPKALRLDGSVRDPNALHMVMLERVRQKCDDEEFDFLHFHLDYYPFSLFSRQPTPFLTTLHGRLDLPEHQPVFTTFSAIPVISISNAQRRPVPQANWVHTIHHGVPEKLLTPRPVIPSYLAVLGRIAPEKGVDRAIKIAIRCGIPLKIAAKVDRADQDYYDEIVRPLIEHPLKLRGCPLNRETSQAVSLAGDTRTKGPPRSRRRYHCRCRDCAPCRVPPQLHAGVAITAPKASAIFPTASGPKCN
jgi:glycosyltransferase involved in cell wall biosynthesis